MERYALLHRIQLRQRITQRMLARQPLHAYIGNHRLLSQMLKQTTNQADMDYIDSWSAAIPEFVQQEDALPPSFVMEEERAALPATTLSPQKAPIAPVDSTQRPRVKFPDVYSSEVHALINPANTLTTSHADFSEEHVESPLPDHSGQLPSHARMQPMPSVPSLQNRSNIPEQTIPVSSSLPSEQPSVKIEIAHMELLPLQTAENAPQVEQIPSPAMSPTIESVHIEQEASPSTTPVTPSPAQNASLYPKAPTASQPSAPPIIDNIIGPSIQTPNQHTDVQNGMNPVPPRPRFIDTHAHHDPLASNTHKPTTQAMVYIDQQKIPQPLPENSITTNDYTINETSTQAPERANRTSLSIRALPETSSIIQQTAIDILDPINMIQQEPIEEEAEAGKTPKQAVGNDTSSITAPSPVADTDTNAKDEDASNTPSTHNNGEMHPTAHDLERPLTRRKERSKSRRYSRIEERSSSMVVSPSTQEQGSTSVVQATTPSQLDSTARRLTPQETKAALAALIPAQDAPQSSSEWLALLQQSKWSKGNKNTATPTSDEHPRQSRGPLTREASSPIIVGAGLIPARVPSTTTSTNDVGAGLIPARIPSTTTSTNDVGAGLIPARIPNTTTSTNEEGTPVIPAPIPAPVLTEVPPQSPASSSVPPLSGIAPITPVEPHANTIQQRPQLPVSHREPSTTIAALDPQTAEPVPQRARLFLRPLIGIDPAEINLHRGAVATEIVSAYRADAIAIGDSILMAEKNSINTPQTLGLLAHELTHIARHRTAYTVPPIIATPQHSSIYPYSHMSSTLTPYAQVEPLAPPTPTSSSTWPTSKGEEYLAQEVEQRVIAQAQDAIQQNNHYPSHYAGRRSAESIGNTESTQRRRGQEEMFAPSLEWGGLPAPWEPLPSWLTARPITSQGSNTSTDNQPSLVSASVPINPSPFKSEMGETPATVVQRAATERTSDRMRHTNTTTNTSTPQAQPETPATPKPDMDLLAQQVYQLLKRRLNVEQRRMK